MGDGPIGLILALLLRRQGVPDLWLLGGREGRLAAARELGAGRTMNYHTFGQDLASSVLRAAGEAFPVVIEASGSPAAMQASLDLAAVGGRIGVVGDYGLGRADFPWNHLLHRELELVGSNASAGAWDEAVRLAVEDKLPLGRLVTHRLPASRFLEGVELTRRRGDDLIKVVLEWME
jgi:L-gulonate 5-dehydrogenase